MRAHTLILAAIIPFAAIACGDKPVDDDTGADTDTEDTDTEDTDTEDTDTEDTDTEDTDDTDDTDPDTGDTDPDTDDTDDTDDTGDTDTDTDTEPEVTNLLTNAGFEDGWDGNWLIWPTDLANYGIVATGDTIYASEDTFTAYEGSNSLKVYSTYYGVEYETPIYQQFSSVTAGTEYVFTGWAMHHADDPLTADHTYTYLSIKYFDDSYNYYGSSDSAHMTNASATGTWTELTATGTVPEGATIAQAAIEWWECVGEGEGCYTGIGGVYYDDLVFGEVVAD